MNTSANITPEMLECISTMQLNGDFQGFIDHLNDIQAMLIDDQDEEPESLLKRMHLLKENKYYSSCMSKFLIDKEKKQ